MLLSHARRAPSRSSATRTTSGAGFAGRKRWQLRETQQRGRLAHSGLPPLIAHVLENRGVGSTSEAQIFLGGKDIALCESIIPIGVQMWCFVRKQPNAVAQVM